MLNSLFLREHGSNGIKRKAQLCFLRQLARLSEMTVGRRGAENRSCKISPVAIYMIIASLHLQSVRILFTARGRCFFSLSRFQRSPSTFAPVYNPRNIFPSYNFSSFFFPPPPIVYLSKKNAFRLGIFFCALLAYHSFARDPHTTIS